MSQVYMTAKLNLADGTIIYPQISLDNVVKSISDPTLVTVATLDGSGDVPMSQLPYVTTIGNDATDTTIPTAAAVRGLANGLQPMLTAGTGTEIINGSTINAMAVNLNDVVINNVPSNGLYLEVEGNTMSVVAPLAANNSAGVIAGASDGVKLVNGVAQFDVTTVAKKDGETAGVLVDVGDGLLVDGGTASIDEASVETTLQDVRIDEGSTVSPVDDQVVTPGNLRGALSVGQAVDVSCAPPQSTVTPQDASLGFIGPMIWTGNINTSSIGMGWTGAGVEFPKFAAGLTYLLVFDIKNIDTQERAWTVRSYGSTLGRGVPNIELQYGQSTRLWSFSDVAYNMGAIVASRTAYGATTFKFEITNWRVYEVTALTWDAVMYLAQISNPDTFFRSASVYSLRDKYLVKQDMVCPFIPTIGMPDNSDLTVAAGLSYKIKYTNDNQHIITADTIPADGYGWDTHVQMFIKGTSSIVFQRPLVLMDALTPNAGHNLSIKWRNGDALVYVDDTNAGSIVISTTGTTVGTLNYFLQQDPGSGQENYIIFAQTTDGFTCDGGTVNVSYGANILGNGTDKTTITGAYTVDSDKSLVLQDLAFGGSTISGAGSVMLQNARIQNLTANVNTSFATVEIVDGSTVNGTGPLYFASDSNITGSALIDLQDTGHMYFSGATSVDVTGATFTHGTGTPEIVSSGTANQYTKYSGGVLYRPWGSGAFNGKFTNCVFDDNICLSEGSAGGGAVFYVDGGGERNFTFTGCTFTNNRTTYTFSVMGFIYGTGKHVFTDCLVTGNTAGFDSTFGFTSSVGSMSAEFHNCVITGNTCNRGGFFRSTYVDVVIDGCTAHSNTTTGVGSLMWPDYCSVTIHNSILGGLVYATGEGKIILGGTNSILGGVWQFTNAEFVKTTGIIEPNTVMDLSAIPANQSTLFTSVKDDCMIVGDNVTFIDRNNVSHTIDACTTGWINATAGFTSPVTVISDNSSVWEATRMKFSNQINAAHARTAKLTDCAFTSAGAIGVTGTPEYLQITGSTINITDSYYSSSNLMYAPVIFIGDSMTDSTASVAFIKDGTTTTFSGVGTYIKGSITQNDFIPYANIPVVTAASGTGAGTLDNALGGSINIIKMQADLTASLTTSEAKTVDNKTLLTSDNDLIIAGDYSFTSGVTMSVEEGTKAITLSGGTFSPALLSISSGTTITEGTTLFYLPATTTVSNCIYGHGGTLDFGANTGLRMAGSAGGSTKSVSSIFDLNITGGYASQGGACILIPTSADLTLDGCTISGGTGGYGSCLTLQRRFESDKGRAKCTVNNCTLGPVTVGSSLVYMFDGSQISFKDVTFRVATGTASFLAPQYNLWACCMDFSGTLKFEASATSAIGIFNGSNSCSVTIQPDCVIDVTGVASTVSLSGFSGVISARDGFTFIKQNGEVVKVAAGWYSSINSSGVGTALTTVEGKVLNGTHVIPAGQTISFSGVNTLNGTIKGKNANSKVAFLTGSTITSTIPSGATIGDGVISANINNTPGAGVVLENITISNTTTNGALFRANGANSPLTCINCLITGNTVSGTASSDNQLYAFQTTRDTSKLVLTNVVITGNTGSTDSYTGQANTVYIMQGIAYVTGCTASRFAVYQPKALMLDGDNTGSLSTSAASAEGKVVFKPGSILRTTSSSITLQGTCQMYVGTYDEDNDTVTTTGTATVVLNGTTVSISGSGNRIDSTGLHS